MKGILVTCKCGKKVIIDVSNPSTYDCTCGASNNDNHSVVSKLIKISKTVA